MNLTPEVKRAAADYRSGFLGKLKSNPAKTTLKFLHRNYKELRSPWKSQGPGDGIHPIPGKLRAPTYFYAGKKGGWFEEYYFLNWKSAADRPLVYLPIFWDHFFFQCQSGSYTPGEFARRYQEMQAILDSIRDDGRLYYTILGMYDFPIWDWHLFPENVCVFACSGTGDVTLPLIGRERQYTAGKKSHHVSFMGNLDGFSDVSGVRRKMHDALKDVAFFGKGADWENVMRGSTFSLAPRGLGPTSFRLYEAISLGSIPIYIWTDKRALPFEDEVDWSELAIVRHESELDELRDWLQSDESRRWASGREELLKDFHERYCNFEAMAAYVERTCRKLADRSTFTSALKRQLT
ncbi:exostosin family protein [Haloferula sp. BvORR071]|uniref:exostosin domain-containing protein n=1 Tax=Haloferula sp. BvORR071 TaxID=1396141 RepID=UPI000558C2ED|nr:exostosin family protein [Haloferula sp. BvORR071]